MPPKKHTSLDRVLGRLDTLDAVNLANLVQRLARERTLFEDIFNALQEGVLVITSDGEIEYANASAHRLIGLGDDELGGKVLWRLVPGLRPTLGVSLDDDDAALPAVAREFELTYPEPRTVRLYMVPFRQVGRGGSRRFAVILSDVTRDKLTTEARIQDERTSSVLLLAAGVAHELGNPLNSLTIHLQLIERKLRKLKAGKDTDSLAESIQDSLADPPTDPCSTSCSVCAATRWSSSPRSRAATGAASASSTIRSASTPPPAVPISTLASPNSRCQTGAVTSTVRTRSAGVVSSRRLSSPRRSSI